MISFEPTQEQRMMQEMVGDFARKKLREQARANESQRRLSAALEAEAGSLMLGNLSIDESLGGASTGLSTQLLVEEELAWGDAGAAFAVPGPHALGHALNELASEEQKGLYLRRFVDDTTCFGAVAWSEKSPHPSRDGFTTTAKREGDAWVLSGEKHYVLHADRASLFVVFAQIDEQTGWAGTGAFLVDAATTEGLHRGERVSTLGLDVASFGSIRFDNVRVSDAQRLLGGADYLTALLRFWARHSLCIAARAVGVARAAWESARSFADERRAFGKPIGHFQAIAFMLADRLIDIDGARGLLWRAAWALDAKKTDHEVLTYAAQASAEALEIAMVAANDGVQIHGGAGFVRDYIAEKFMRDAKQLALCAPTVVTCDLLLAALEVGAKLDPAMVLPTPDLQPIFT